MRSDTVRLMGAPPGKARYLTEVWDERSGTFFVPDAATIPPDMAHLHKAGIRGQYTALAIVDSGLLTAHPWIAARLIESVDFTGEGVEDFNGHGTLVALLALLQTPETKLINVKIVDASGEGTETSLVEALKWCAKVAKKRSDLFFTANLSLGIYRNCRGNCRVCRAAIKTRRAGVLLVAAAGNKGPEQASCPQTAGLLGHFPVIAALDQETGMPMPYSGKGNLAAPEPRKFVPL